LGFKLNCSEEHQRQFSTSRRLVEKQNSGNQALESGERKENIPAAKGAPGTEFGLGV
jgi:hypothetical protein